MKFDDIIRNRFSARSYTNREIEKDTILEILEAGRIAPSAVNYQPWFFIVITEKDILDDFNEVYPRDWFKTAPVCIVVCADHNQSWKRKSDGKDFADIDIAIATDHIILKATELGLGTCWVCNFDAEKAHSKLGLPENIEPLVLIPLGYSDSVPKIKDRKSIDELVHWQKYSN